MDFFSCVFPATFSTYIYYDTYYFKKMPLTHVKDDEQLLFTFSMPKVL